MQPQRNVAESGRKPSAMQLGIYLCLKRMSDIVMCFILLLLFAPMMLWIAYRIYKKEGKPVLTIEQGFKKNNKPFEMVTYRVQSHPSEVIRRFPPKPVFRSKHKRQVITYLHETNITPIMTSTGMWLTRYNLHKLPLLIHVLKGDMSFIRTRLPIVDIIHQCHLRHIKPLPIKQGIIGYSDTQLDLIKNDKQLAQSDLYYLEHCSIWFDLKVLLQF